ncbi:MAG: sulfate adenylyltransferase, partial [Vicinamibacterales bacterium]
MSGATISPHGGTLVSRWAPAQERQRWLGELAKLPRITLNRREISDLEMIAIGTFSPLEGFLREADYESVVSRMRLANDLPWTIPVTLAVTAQEEHNYHPGDDVALCEESGKPLAILH